MSNDLIRHLSYFLRAIGLFIEKTNFRAGDDCALRVSHRSLQASTVLSLCCRDQHNDAHQHERRRRRASA